MTKRIIDELEVIDVDQDNRYQRLCRMGLVYDALEQAADRAAICYAREIVAARSDMQSICVGAGLRDLCFEHRNAGERHNIDRMEEIMLNISRSWSEAHSVESRKLRSTV